MEIIEKEMTEIEVLDLIASQLGSYGHEDLANSVIEMINKKQFEEYEQKKEEVQQIEEKIALEKAEEQESKKENKEEIIVEEENESKTNGIEMNIDVPLPEKKVLEKKDDLLELIKYGKLYQKHGIEEFFNLSVPKSEVNVNEDINFLGLNLYDNTNQLELLNLNNEGNSTNNEENGLSFNVNDDMDEFESPELPSLTVWFTTAHKMQARTAAFSPDGIWLATGSADCSLKVLEVAKIKKRSEEEKPVVKALYDHIGPINELAFHPNGQVLASASEDCCVKLFDLSKPQVKKAFRYLQDSYPIKSLSFHPSGDFLALATESEKLRIYDIRTFQSYTPNSSQHHTQGLTQVRYSPDGKTIITSSLDGDIKIWDGVSGTLVKSLPKAHSSTPIASIQISKNNNYLLSYGLDSIVRCWDLKMGKQVMEYLGAHTPWLANACFTRDENHVLAVTGEPGHGIVGWCTKSGKKVAGYPAQPFNNPQPIQKVVASPTDDAFVTCSDDARVRYWGTA
ncbi:WD40 repeat-like protein [Neoconidiobolus thromboides FSU 785]|nr:WD40 repeat-like protein [Neoconidiobolus thromboides FSU 785]